MPDEGLTEVTAHRALLVACDRAGLRPDGAELIRLGENAMYALPGQGVVVRVARSADLVDKVRKELAVARWLASQGFPGVRVRDDLVQPVEADGRLATFWEYVPPSTATAGIGDLARLLRSFHELPAPGFDLPGLDPFPVMRRRLALVSGIKASDVRFLEESCELVEASFRELMARTEPRVVHGDAHRGNVLMRGGESLLIDYEVVSRGPVAWDLVPTATAVDRFGLPEAEYARFAAVYGWDVTGWDGYAVLRTVRELGMTTWLMQNAQEGPAAEEFALRMESLRKDDLGRRWHAL
ncbi:aminoglycoside phosphotransferase family protein [Streptomyces carminius]|uniref:Aminoglycoside phosphotransferase family protein n=1 Tax=Streptomyces carminius TaxID=2665496 RepID=A0A2M8LV91_9ACTN|nr:aminoglycoside phosphotransferase family protein [Streptomyces carminius]PJE95874.1 aminoglycoside phosphotransferase family protein [Streptomyces carminius]